MALDKLVDSAQLDADLTTVADAIRTKGGTSASLSFPSGMVRAIEDLPSGATEPYIEETYDANGKLISAALHGYTFVRDYAFDNAGYDTLQSVSLPDTVESIGRYAFYNNQELNFFALPTSLKIINSMAFYTNTHLTGLTSLPSQLETIGGSAFKGCGIPSMTFPSALKTIGIEAFRECGNITSVTFEGTPETIGSNAFFGCNKLITINVPWEEGEVTGAPWGATNATINYLYGNGFYPISAIPLMAFADTLINAEYKYYTKNGEQPSAISVTSNSATCEISEVVIDSASNSFTFTISESVIKSIVVTITVTLANGRSLRQECPIQFCDSDLEYEVQSVEGAAYGFILNSNDFYESQNKGQSNSAAVCKLIYYAAGKHMYFDCINSGESNYDYGLISNIDTVLATSNAVDSNDKIFKSFKGRSNTSIQTVDYGIQDSDLHFVYLKFRKDGSGDQGNDSLQFKVRFE